MIKVSELPNIRAFTGDEFGYVVQDGESRQAVLLFEDANGLIPYVDNQLLNQHGDVTITTPVDGEVLKYDFGTLEWVNGLIAADGVSYNNSISGLTAVNVQDAVDEIELDRVDRMVHWESPYVPDGPYTKNALVLDQGWTMISNKDTVDRAAPQPLGSPSFILGDTPAFLTESFLGVVHSGVDITFSEPGWVETLRVYVPFLSVDTNYRVIIADVTDPGNVLTKTIESPILNEDAWTVLLRIQKPYKSGTILRVIVDALTSSSTSQVTGGWSSGGDKDTPLVGEWSHDRDRELFINSTDLDSVDRTGELMGIIINSTIRFNLTADPNTFKEYRVTAAPIDRGSFIDWNVQLIDEQGNLDNEIGEATSMIATVPIAQATEYAELVSFFPTGQPEWGSVSGYLSLDGVEQVVPLNMYGVDVEFQRASISEDWDLVSFSEGLT